MLTLRHSTTSPFVRKVSATIIEIGIDENITKISTNPWDPKTDLPDTNPLGKVPALITEDGEIYFDSPLICEYLDATYGGKLFPAKGQARWNALRQQALADGIMEAAIGRILESRRSENLRSENVFLRCQAAVNRSLDVLENLAVNLSGEFTIGHLSIACALEYLDFRFSSENWRNGRAKLAKWHEGVSSRPSLRQTIPMD